MNLYGGTLHIQIITGGCGGTGNILPFDLMADCTACSVHESSFVYSLMTWTLFFTLYINKKLKANEKNKSLIFIFIKYRVTFLLLHMKLKK
jgi:succinate-acetate transporter protein